MTADLEALVAWLREQLDEEERTAQDAEALAPSPWRLEGTPSSNVVDSTGAEVVETESGFNPPSITVQAHIARQHPARMLAEVEVKREILALYASAVELTAEEPDLVTLRSHVTAYAAVVKRLAPLYADRPGYREEWRP